MEQKQIYLGLIAKMLENLSEEEVKRIYEIVHHKFIKRKAED